MMVPINVQGASDCSTQQVVAFCKSASGGPVMHSNVWRLAAHSPACTASVQSPACFSCCLAQSATDF